MPDRVVVMSEAGFISQQLEQELRPIDLSSIRRHCQGTAPMWFQYSDFSVNADDILFGTIEDCPPNIGAATLRGLACTQIVADVSKGSVDTLAQKALGCVGFGTDPVFSTNAEAKVLDAAAPLPTGPEAFALDEISARLV